MTLHLGANQQAQDGGHGPLFTTGALLQAPYSREQEREADRIGSGVPKAVPYKLRHLLFMIEKVKRDPISPKMLKIDGTEIMELLGIKPGPKVGKILAILLEEVIEEPAKNENVLLKRRVRELYAIDEAALDAMVAKAKETKEEFEEGVEREIKKQFHV